MADADGGVLGRPAGAARGRRERTCRLLLRSPLLCFSATWKERKIHVKSGSERPIHVTYSATLFGSQSNDQTTI